MIAVGLIVGYLFRVYVYPKIWTRVQVRRYRVVFGAIDTDKRKGQ